MPTQTLKKNKNGTRIFKIPSVSVPLVMLKNVKRNITYKVPINLLEPKELLKAKLKNRSNTIKKAHMIKLKEAEERRQRLESQARFAAMLRESRARNNAARRGPGVRGTAVAGNTNLESLPAPRTLMPSNLFAMMASKSANSTVRKANLLKMAHIASKATGAPAPAPARKPLGKFWKKEGNNSNSNSD